MSTFTIGARSHTGTVSSNVTDNEMGTSLQNDGEMKPSLVSDQYWIFESAKGPVGPTDGKWMLFYLNEDIDNAWMKAKSLFRTGCLTGISSMKVSTARENSRASDSNSQVLICYCGPAIDESNVIRYGENLVTQMRYKPFNTNPFVYYKSDAQTAAGTRATGQGKNHLYKIRVPTFQDSSSNGSFLSNDAIGDGIASVPIRTPPDAPMQLQLDQRRLGKRKLDTTDEVEETRKRMSCLSPSRIPENNGSTALSFNRFAGTALPASYASSASSATSPPDDSTTRIKFRLENIPGDAIIGDPIVGSFHIGQRLGELVGFLTSQMPLGVYGGWSLLKTFPTEELNDMSLTIQDAGLANAVVIARLMR